MKAVLYSLRGELAVKGSDFLVVDCSGVGYRCSATLNTLASLPAGGEVFVYTHMLVREDAIELFGFANERELESFRLLIGVSGVGPKSALAILSDMTPDKFALAVAAGDVKAFTRAPGVGAKTAQRILLELKDKITKDTVSFAITGASAAVPIASGSAGEAIAALAALGYSQSEAAAVVAKLDQTLSVNDMIKAALKKLAMM